ncbi:DUF1963 domain-containing protein [Frigoribacterium sp. Leaf172]|uniref:DUF1963 domain-containing protein n=1 Tax=Frigoribacterium sp. Leaf172 TaxID=1736285 RepID=UPI0006F57A71|nr:DUF1963 domain-containing protein [Frigoribacterium sp. Leaf172]KQR65999.1 hypothetical protein ASF89_02225 [Frigoribacterium sp. Leaf172]
MKDKNRPPIHSYRFLIVDWLQKKRYREARLDERVEFSVAYTEQGSDPGLDTILETAMYGGSWLGGPAAGITQEDWPRRRDGQPLAHVANFHLGEASGVMDSAMRAGWPDTREDLPHHGILQIFHDLETYGTEPADGDTGGWLVRWLPEPDLTLLASSPDDLDLPTDAAQEVTAMATFSIPTSLDLDVTTEKACQAAEEATIAFQRMWNWQRTQDRHAGPAPITHLYGYSQAGHTVAGGDILPGCLPLAAPGDSYRLVADIESGTTLDGWFGDASPLEVWMRQSDLDARSFDRAWCIIRAD